MSYMTRVIAHYHTEFYRSGEDCWPMLQKARPIHPDQHIRVPHHDIGFYDQLDPAVRKWQGETAKRYGIEGFCYRHYWRGPEALFDSTLQLMLIDNCPDISFCLYWDNELPGLWPAFGDEAEWDRHIRYLMPFFRHPHYIRHMSRAVFVVGRPDTIPRFRQRMDYYNNQLREAGFDGIHVIMTLGQSKYNFIPYLSQVDGLMHVQPTFLGQPEILMEATETADLYHMLWVYEYIINEQTWHPNTYYGTLPCFDNSLQASVKPSLLLYADPYFFTESIASLMWKTKDFFFINSWNNWKNGTAIEPDSKDGYDFLLGVRNGTLRFRMKLGL